MVPSLLDTWMSMPLYAPVNRLSNERCSVASSTSAPAMNVTARTTAVPDSRSRSLRDSKLLRVAWSIVGYFSRSRTVSAVGSCNSLARCPSARNTTRSA